MSIDFKVEGAEEIERALLELSKEYGARNVRATFNPVMREAMKPVEEEIRSKTPVETGQLRESTGITARLRDVNRALRRSLPLNVSKRNIFAAVSVGWLKPQAGRDERDAALARVITEYGATRGTSPRPPGRIIRGALEGHSKRIISDIAKGWVQALEKRRRFLSRKAAKGKLKIR